MKDTSIVGVMKEASHIPKDMLMKEAMNANVSIRKANADLANAVAKGRLREINGSYTDMERIFVGPWQKSIGAIFLGGHTYQNHCDALYY